MDALPKVGNNLFGNWQSREGKLRDKDFVEMLRGFEAKTPSMYKNAFLMEFAGNVAAAPAIRRKTAQMLHLRLMGYGRIDASGSGNHHLFAA